MGKKVEHKVLAKEKGGGKESFKLYKWKVARGQEE